MEIAKKSRLPGCTVGKLVFTCQINCMFGFVGQRGKHPRERERRREDKIDEYVLLAYSSQSAERLSGTMGGRESKPVEVLP